MDKKVALITGSSRGIGKAILYKFAMNNYDVILNYNESEKEANLIKEDIENKYNVKVLTIKANLENEEEIINLVNKSLETFSKVDVLVNNAGICLDKPFSEKSKDDFTKILNVNLIAPFLLSKYLKDTLVENKGNIINISSTNAINTYYPESMDYDASKAGLISLTKNLSIELSPSVRVNAVAPGWTNTDMNQEIDPNYKKEEENKILLKRFATPEEIANVVYFLSSSEASYINGEVIKVDGGSYGN